VEFLARARGLDLGLHVNLTEGRALAGPQRTLTDADGLFRYRKEELWRRAAAGEVDPTEVSREVTAQWERAEALGLEATHVDGHNHVHLLPGALEALPAGVFVRVPVDRVPWPPFLPADFARRAEAPGRRRTDGFTGYRFAAAPSEEAFLESLAGATGSIEFMVHPGARPGSPFTSSADRDREAEILGSPSLAREIARRGIRVASFRELPCA
jgi:predicted glycoside hydrolase/deacetylase ChbG (UPF0249 family)